MPKKIYIVNLDEAEREHLQKMLQTGKHSTRHLTRARILIKASDGWTDDQIATALGIGRATVERTRQRFVERGLDAIKDRPRPGKRPKLDAKAEARLIAEACSKPPDGQAHWTMQLLADRLVELRLVDSVSDETVRRVLKKNKLKPWLKKQWCIPLVDAAFAASMEEVLDLYATPYNPLRPKVNFDESSKQLIKETRLPLPAQPDQPERYDYQYERNGVRNIFMMVEPQAGWRHVVVTEHHAKPDFAHQMKWLVDERYPQAEVIEVVLDNLCTHTAASLYETFDPADARRILRKINFHYTPKHGSWLNMAEIELSVLQRQCLDRRIPDQETLEREIAVWEQRRNDQKSTIDWRFSLDDARSTLKR
ncbi:MAG: IS630 family transposase, partial [Ramlibacter sp.]|nr:IS630 family transposase [Ramlibacter sp.]